MRIVFSAMKTRLLAVIALALLSLCSLSRAAEAAWLTDYQAAVKQATAEKKALLLDFTGSDWCIWCARLDSEVFSQKAFGEYAAKNLVLVKLDFPAKKPQSATEKKQNEELAKKYGIEGFPTIVVLDAGEKKLGELGYQAGGAEKWIASLDKVVKQAAN
ncbi:thioredoxin-related protein [Opitutaceae bacterium TAV1]|nr:thioredoxin-related protein [Opitutaceae bacterium TAV1]